MQEFPINFWAVLVAALIRFVVTAGWHSPAAFGRAWMKLAGVNEAEMRSGMVRAVAVDFVGGLVMAFVLLHAVHYAGAGTMGLGAAVGFFNWLGFVAVTGLAGVVYEKVPFRLFLIDTSGQLIALCLMGALLAVWI